MSSDRKMSYSGWECILTHLDFNFRFSLARRCPPLRTLHKKIPIRIRCLYSSEHKYTYLCSLLYVAPNKIKINTTTYQIGIIRQYHDRRTPRAVQEYNDAGGSPNDVSREGLRQTDIWQNFVLNPSNDVEGDLAKYQKEKEELEKTGNGGERLLELEDLIEGLMDQKLPITLWYAGQDPEPIYSHYTQLKISRDDNPFVKFERMEFSTSLYRHTDYLLSQKLFHHRQDVYAKKLEVEVPDTSQGHLLAWTRHSIQSDDVVLIETLEHPRESFVFLRWDKSGYEFIGKFPAARRVTFQMSQDFPGDDVPGYFVQFVTFLRGFDISKERHFTMEKASDAVCERALEGIRRLPGAKVHRLQGFQLPICRTIVTFPVVNNFEVVAYFQETPDDQYALHVEFQRKQI